MRKMVFALIAVAAGAGVVACIGAAYGEATGDAAPIFLKEIPREYRDWRLISVAHEGGNLNSFSAILGNDAAIKLTARESFPFRTARSLPLYIIITSHRRKTTRSSADRNPSFPARPRTFSLW
jgi:hypothetical protein